MNYIKLNNGISIPQLGIGGFAQSEEAIIEALNMGYRLIDTARNYENEKEVGNAIRKSKINREDIFVTTKLWTDDVRQGRTYEAFEESISKLQLDYVDLYLIHWPAINFEKAWSDMEKIYKEGRARAIGVSNFQAHHLEELSKTASIIPAVNQIESHPYFNNDELINYCKSKNISIQAWCPLGGTYGNVLNDEVLLSLAKKYEKTPAQIVIRWHIQRDIILFPKSSRKERMLSNKDVFNFELSNDDMKLINSINRNRRVGADPDNFNF